MICVFVHPLVVVLLALLVSTEAATRRETGKGVDHKHSTESSHSFTKIEKKSKKGHHSKKQHPEPTTTTLRVMSYNIWGGGGNEGKPINETLAVLRAANADIVGLQETRLEGPICNASYCPPDDGESVAHAIAKELGFYIYDQTAVNAALWANAIISRFPILYSTTNDLGVAIDVGGGTKNNNIVFAFNIHLTDFPYQPYQLLNIEYGPAPFLTTEMEAIQAAKEARGPALELLYSDLKEVGCDDFEDDDTTVFIFGDFNEPSFRDWTNEAVEVGHQPIRVEYPTTKQVEQWGFMDAYREIFPNEVEKPAYTWTPTSDEMDPQDHHDRIDFVFVRGGRTVVVVDAAIVGEAESPHADIVVTPYPSDHRAVVATVQYDRTD